MSETNDRVLTFQRVGYGALLVFISLSACHVAVLMHREAATPPPGVPDWQSLFLTLPQAERAAQHLQYYTSIAHSAGTPGDYDTAVYTHRKFLEYGLNSSIVPYEVLLSFPLRRSVTMLHPLLFRAELKEADVPEDTTMNHPGVMDTFNGYSPSGNVTGPLVYVNFGSKGDFELLKQAGVPLNGSIGLARYGRLFRGTKAMLAQEYGLIGLLIYSDPFDDGYVRGPVFPNGPYRPATGVQRGSVQFLSKCPGDPRRQVCQPDDPDYDYKKGIPAIPVQPLSWADAKPLIDHIGGHGIPHPHWSGAANNTFVGPGPAVVNLFLDIKFNVTPIWNVMANITGVDSSLTVMVGNHRDAWVFGAVDPNSGTSAMLETARCLGLLLSKGWRPKKNIVFGSWDGEEYGLVGSTAYAEELGSLNSKIVAYINLDTAVSGPKLNAGATPSLENVFRKVLSRVNDPDTGTALDILFANTPVTTLGSGSDYTAFLDHFGVPSLDFGFDGKYGVYHSVYDDYFWMKSFGDPTFGYHRASAQICGLLAMELADSHVIPLDFGTYALRLSQYLNTTRQTLQLYNHTADLSSLVAAIESFTAAADRFQRDRQQQQVNNASLNARAMQVERAFISDKGLPLRPYYKHVIQAPGLYEGYGSSTFPGLAQTAQAGDWNGFEEKLQILVYHINLAATALSPK